MASQYITTPIYYVNGDPHIGHAHTTIMGDIMKRVYLMRGDKVFYSTGTDEHGQKNQEAVEKSGLDAETYLARQSDRFRRLFKRLNVDFDFYARTSLPGHKAVVETLLSRLYEKELIYKKDYTGLYCVGCEQFKKVTDLDEQGRCPDHLTVPVKQTEVNYFFKLHPFQDWLIETIKSNDDWIRPAFYRREVLAMLEEPLEDLCISRPKSRVWLGIELPFDRDYVTYVWFDALINYISNIGYGTNPEFDFWWGNVTHLMAKDIIKTHIIYWPIMLKAAGIEPPRRYRIHGYWVGEGGQKMSKSLGNFVDPDAVIDRVGVDALRFYLAKTMSGSDAQISESLVVACYNTDLANNLGNLHARVLKFAKKRCGDKVPSPASIHPDDRAVQEFVAESARRETERLDLETIPELIRAVLAAADRMNTHYNDAEPWKMVKDPAAKDRFDSILYAMLDSLRMLFTWLWPVMPETAEKALASIGAPPVTPDRFPLEIAPDGLEKGAALGDAGALFPRLDVS